MRCFYHTSEYSVGQCSCGKFLCKECVEHRLMCYQCIQEQEDALKAQLDEQQKRTLAQIIRM